MSLWEYKQVLGGKYARCRKIPIRVTDLMCTESGQLRHHPSEFKRVALKSFAFFLLDEVCTFSLMKCFSILYFLLPT